MPTIFAHGAIGFAAARTFSKTPHNDWLAMASVFLAFLPDVDGLFFRLIPYRYLLGHRGLTHSLLFAGVAGLVTASIFVQKGWNGGHTFAGLAVFFSLVTASHGFFDAMTTGGLGVAFFAPFDNTRYFFPVRPIPVSPMSLAGLMSDRGRRVITTELGLFWTFAGAVVLWRGRTRIHIVCGSLLATVGAVCWLLALGR